MVGQPARDRTGGIKENFLEIDFGLSEVSPSRLFPSGRSGCNSTAGKIGEIGKIDK